MTILYSRSWPFRMVAFTVLLLASTLGIAQDSVFEWKFKEVRQTGFGLYGIFSLENVSGKDIDDVRLSVYLRDIDGEVLSATAITDATPGLVWQRVGETIEVELPLDRRPSAKAALEEDPKATILDVQIDEIAYAD